MDKLLGYLLPYLAKAQLPTLLAAAASSSSLFVAGCGKGRKKSCHLQQIFRIERMQPNLTYAADTGVNRQGQCTNDSPKFTLLNYWEVVVGYHITVFYFYLF